MGRHNHRSARGSINMLLLGLVLVPTSVLGLDKTRPNPAPRNCSEYDAQYTAMQSVHFKRFATFSECM